MIQPEDAPTCRVEVAGILKQVEAYQVAEEERLEHLASIGEHLVDI